MSFPTFTKKTLPPSSTIGEQLKQARRRKRLRITDMVSRLKVRQDYLEALEEDRFDRLPGDVYAKRFIKAYASVVGLDGSGLVVELDRVSKRRSPKMKIISNWQPERFSITPKFLLGITAVLTLGSVFGYILFQLSRFSLPPQLEIISPADGMQVVSDTIDVIGKASPGSIVFINSESVAQQLDGSFSQPVAVSVGVNTLSITAKNRFNKQTVKRLSVIKSSGDGQVYNRDR